MEISTHSYAMSDTHLLLYFVVWFEMHFVCMFKYRGIYLRSVRAMTTMTISAIYFACISLSLMTSCSACWAVDFGLLIYRVN